MGDFVATLAGPGAKGARSSDMNLSFRPDRGKFQNFSCCKEVQWIQIYNFAGNPTSSAWGLPQNTWTLDADAGAGPYYPNNPNPGNPQRGGGSTLIDVPGIQFMSARLAPKTSSISLEACAVCSKTGGIKGMKGEDEKFVFGCVSWGHAFKYTNGYPTQSLRWINDIWWFGQFDPSTKSGPGRELPSSRTYVGPGHAPSAAMTTELNASY